MRTPGPITPTCPRCGYDQSGVADAWEDRCPVEGTCPECGTAFAWADLFDPSRRDVPWLAEHARGVRDAARRTPGMLGRLARPCGFWRAVGVYAAVRPWRLGAWCLGCLAAAHAATGV